MNARRAPEGWRERADRAVERGRRLDRWIPAFLLDSPISRAGYLYGCTVGWLWGSLWSRGRVERHGELHVFRGLPSWAFPRGGVCVGNCFLTGDAPVDERLLAHESVHERQWRRYGALMPVLYNLAGRDPLQNRFEIEAGLEDGNYIPRRR
ncbi:MAG: Fe-S oxidoreductase [Microbacterium sp.]|nr:Fe-S oxidoreductase [Microbacterium sp.]